MRLTIIPEDKLVIINGRAINGIDLSFINQTYRAIQWYETHGEIEVYENGVPIENKPITSIDEFQPAIDEWNRIAYEQDNPPPLTLEQKIDNYSALVQARLDSFAQEKDYLSLLHACSYVNSQIEQYRLEAEKCIQLRDATWTSAYTIFNAVIANERELPEPFEVFEQELPTLQWT